MNNIQYRSIKPSTECPQVVSASFVKDCDANINGFRLPIRVNDNEEYVNRLKDKIEEFKKIIEDKKSCFDESNLYDKVEATCNLICLALDDLRCGKNEKGDEKVAELLKDYLKNEFAVSCLDKNYAFRGLAPYEDLHSSIREPEYYNKSLECDLSFYRARVVVKEEVLSEIKDIISLPFSKRDLSGNLRFSVRGEVCLYLSTTSYCCAYECRWNDSDNTKALYVSAFKFNDEGKNLKILNLTVSEPLINGIGKKNRICGKNLQCEMIKIFPLVLATSFVVDNNDKERERIEYLLSQSLIRVIKKLGVDGVAYLSKQGKDDFQYPHGVNLALPMGDISEEKEYSDLYRKCTCTKPVCFSDKNVRPDGAMKSYINQCYPESDKGFPRISAQVSYGEKTLFYGNVWFSKVDDYLMNQEFYDLTGLVKR